MSHPLFSLCARALTLLLGLTVSAVFTACATSPAGTPAPTAASPTVVLATLPPVATTILKPTLPAVALPDDVLVIYHKSGGIAGVDDTLTVHQGGLVELTSRSAKPKSLQVTEPGLLQIRNLLEQKDFGALQPQYQAQGADLFFYTITARDTNGQPKTVTTMDHAPHPDFLGLLIVMLDNLRAIVAKNG